MKKRVLVTGASKGIGKAIAIAAASADYDVVVHYHRDKDGALDTVNRIKESGGR
jgi:3-oxoacyl-[acyl-carrier protein] reductase